MSWRIIRPQIITLLNTIPEIAEVAPVPKIKFDKYPAVHVVPSENASDYETTMENMRTYAWSIRAFYETKSGGIENAIKALEEIVDKIIDKFDLEDLKDSTQRTVGTNLPLGYMYINIFAMPSRWGDLPDEEEIMAEITVKINLSIDATAIT